MQAERPRVLHFIYDDLSNPWVGGGGARRAFEINRRLADRVDVTTVTGTWPGARDVVIDGVKFARRGSARGYAVSRATYAAAANRMLRRDSYDAAVFDYSAYTPILLPRARPCGMALHHLTGSTARSRWGAIRGAVVGAVEGRMLSRARFISLSASFVEPAVRALATPNAHVEVVGAGVAPEFYQVVREDAGYILYFGRIDVFQKGLDTLLDAFSRMLQVRPELRLKIAGRGNDHERLARMAADLGITASIDMLGAVDDDERLRLMAGASCMLMPSRFEGFGLAAAEAMAAGVPLIAADVDALPEVVAPPDGGVLVPGQDAGALATATLRLMEDPQRRAALSLSARRSAHRFDWDAVADRHLAFLRTIIHASP